MYALFKNNLPALKKSRFIIINKAVKNGALKHKESTKFLYAV
jgi:hypothetical protein